MYKFHTNAWYIHSYTIWHKILAGESFANFANFANWFNYIYQYFTQPNSVTVFDSVIEKIGLAKNCMALRKFFHATYDNEL